MLDIGNIDYLINELKEKQDWKNLQTLFNQSESIIYVGHGGNLAIADHIAVDTVRLTQNKKVTFSPGSAIAATSFINDSNFDKWLIDWFKPISNLLDKSKTLVIGISSSGKSKDIINLFHYCDENNYKTALISAKSNNEFPRSTTLVNTNCNSYHKSGVVALALGYQLILDSGFSCPSIS